MGGGGGGGGGGGDGRKDMVKKTAVLVSQFHTNASEREGHVDGKARPFVKTDRTSSKKTEEE